MVFDLMVIDLAGIKLIEQAKIYPYAVDMLVGYWWIVGGEGLKY